jgi:magnesium-transporting ATPase (P-type)
MTQSPNPPSLDYHVPKAVGPAPAQMWVIFVLLLLQFAGIVAGRMLWSVFFRGKDPQIEFFWSNGIGIALFALMCFFFNKRLTRFHPLDAVVVLLLGMLSSVAGMGWGILDGYGQ